MLIVTAHDLAYKEVGDLCLESLDGYCGDREHHCVRKWIPREFDRKPSWYKIVILKRFLPRYRDVMWIDADALIVGGMELPQLQEHELFGVCEDKNGINCGMMIWRHSAEAMALLDEIYSKVEFLDHIWWEQAALMSLLLTLEGKYQILDKQWNAYPVYEGVNNPQIIHYPGMSKEEKLPLMRKSLKEGIH